MNAAPTVEVMTFGCRLNIVESEVIRGLATADADRDLVVVNSCAVTAEAVRQVRRAVRRMAREKPSAEIVLTGCAAEIEPALGAMPEVSRVVPNASKTRSESWRRVSGTATPAPFTSRTASRHTRGFVEVQNGCDHRCTFCVIPFGRGASRSVAPERIVAIVRSLVEAGAREAVLTGVDLTSYRSADEGGLGALVRLILREVPDLPRLRLSSIDCIEADADLFAALAEEPRLMPHLHVSLQHGSDLILKRMKRRHLRAESVAFCREIRRLRPDIAFGADLIAGFPTETEVQAEESERLVADCGIAHLHVFPYSARSGTPAARMPAVPGELVKARAARLRAIGDAALSRHLDRHVGTIATVLAERGGRGRTEDFSSVSLVAEVEPGRIVEVAIGGHDGRELAGTA